MQWQNWNIINVEGIMYSIDFVDEKDAQKMIEFIKKIKEENLDTLYHFSHIPDYKEEKEFIQNYYDWGGIIFCAKIYDEIVGLITVARYKNPQLKHSVIFGISVLKEYRDKGIGTALINRLIEWSKQNDVFRIELEVFSNNFGAIKLYKKLGFVTEGVKKGAVLINDDYKDIIMMVYRVRNEE